MQHVNGDDPFFKVTMNTIYNNKNVDLIKKIIFSSPVEIWKMSLKQIYNSLLDFNMLKGLDNSITSPSCRNKTYMDRLENDN